MKKFSTLFTDSAREFKNVRTITACGLFAALAFILESFSIQLGSYIKIGFSGLPNEIVDFMFGPVVGSIFSGALDILKLIVHPTGPWIPGLTLDAVLAGLIYGAFLYKKPVSLWRILAAKLIVALFINVLLGSFWLSQVYTSKTYVMLLPTRFAKNMIMWPINSLVIFLVLKVLEMSGAFKLMKVFVPKKKKAEK